MKKMQEDLEALLEDYRNADNQGEVQRLEKECKQVQMDMQATNKEKSDMESRYDMNLIFELSNRLLLLFFSICNRL